MQRASTTDPMDSDRVRATAARVLLAIASVAFLATSSVGTSASTTTTGVVDLRAGQEVVLPAHVAIGPSHPNVLPTSSLDVFMTSVDGVHDVDPGAIVTVRDATGSPVTGGAPPSSRTRIPLPESCAAGCELDYSLVFSTVDSGAAGQIGRYEATLRIQYQGYSGDPASLALSVAGGPVGVTGQWVAAIAAALGLIGGVLIGGRIGWSVDRRRFVPGAVLVTLLVVAAGRAALVGRAPETPLLWDIVPLVGLALGVAWALSRGADGEWSWLAVAGWATVVIGGLLFLGEVGLLPSYRPVELVVISVAGWMVVGIVIGQGRAMRARDTRLRPFWTTVAVVSQAVILVGLIGAGLWAVDPTAAFTTMSAYGTGLAVPAIIAVPIVVWGLLRWLAGKGVLLGLVNAVLFPIGLVGVWGLSALATLAGTGEPLSTLGVGAVVGLGACVAGFLAAFKAPARPVTTTPAEPASSDAPPNPEPTSVGLPIANA